MPKVSSKIKIDAHPKTVLRIAGERPFERSNYA